MMFSTTTSSMQGFFKTAVTSTTSRYTNNNNNNNLNEDIHKYNNEFGSGIDMMGTPQLTPTNISTPTHHSILPGSMNLFAQHESKANTVKTIHGLTEIDIKMVINDKESFHIIQEQLRDRYAQTNALVKHIGIELIRERYNVMKRQQQLIEQQKRMEDRKLQIARELTEARIKARQALNLTISKKSSCSDDDDDETDTDETKEERKEYDNDNNNPTIVNNNNNNNSPTSVMATLTIDESKIDTFKGGLLSDEYDSEDGDIQEVMEE